MRFSFQFLIFLIGNPCFGQQNNKALLENKLDSIFANVFKANEPGGSIFIQKGKEVLYAKSFGLANLETKEKFTSKTVSNIGSVSKTFVAYGILILQQQGKLSIEDNLLKYFPDFKNKDLAAKIKIKHLLNHTSGLPDIREVEQNLKFYLTAKDADNFAPLKNTEALKFQPGSKSEYSNPAYNGLALIIEQVSGMKWQKFIEQNIFKPAGMKTSKITDGPFPEKGVAHGYGEKNGKFEEFDYGEVPTFAAAGNGGIWSSIEDLQKYIAAMQNCKFLDCETVKFSQTVWVPENWSENQPPLHAFTWKITPGYGKIIQHEGGQGGFRGQILVIPKYDMVVFWLSNNGKIETSKVLKPLENLGYLN